MKYLAALLLGIICCGTSFAQVEETLETYKSRYPNDLGVYLQKKEAVTITIDSEGKLNIESQITEEMLYLDEQANMMAEHSIPYSESFTLIEDINAYTLAPRKNKYKKVPVNEIITVDARSSGVFADDLKKKRFHFPAISMGAKSMLEYKEVTVEPYLFGGWYFSGGLPVERSEFSITFPEGVVIEHKPFNLDGVEVAFTETTKGGKTTLRWVAQNITTDRGNENEPNFRYFEPHLIAYVSSYQNNGETVELLNGVDGLHRWYSTLLDMRERNTDDALKEEVERITEGIDDELAKVRAIYYWVQENVKYVAFEEGMGGFIPRDPYQIYDKRFGDCKDMSSLLSEMLELAGIPSHLTWIGTRDIPYSYQEVPTPASDNHMICTYKHGDTYYFLDATGPFFPLELPTTHIQGKEALLHINSNEHRIVSVPVPGPEANTYADTTVVSLADGVVSGSGRLQISGYPKVHTSLNLLNRKKEDHKKYFTSYLERGNNKFFLDSVQHFDLGDRDKNLRVQYDFRIEDYLLTNGDELYFNPHLDRGFAANVIDTETQTAPVEWDYKRQISEVLLINVPEGSTPTWIPENTEYKTDKFGYSVTYTQEGDQIRVDSYIYLDFLLLMPSEFESWNKMLKSMSKAYKEIIIIKTDTE